jgi:hypothetical protein
LKDHIESDQIVSWLKEYFVSIAVNFNALLWCFVPFCVVLDLIDPMFVGWQTFTIQEVWAYSWGEQRAC